MPLTRYRRTWIQQPQGAFDLSDDWSSRVSALAFGNASFVNNSAGSLAPVLGTPTIAAGIAGIGPTFTGGAQRFASPGALAPIAGSDPFSLEILCSITSAASLAGFLSIGTAIELGQQRGLLAFSGANNRRIYFWGGDRDLASDQDWRIDGSLQHVIVTSGGSGTTMRFYRDGEQFFSGTTPTLGTTQAAAFHLGRAGWDVTPVGTLFKAGIYNAELSAADVRALYENPWRVFRPRSIWVPVSAGGAGAISVPAGSLVLTGYAPTVIATANQTIAVPAGSLSLSAFAPTVVSAVRVQVPAGTLSLTGYAPTVVSTANNRIAVPAGSLTLTGYAPTVAAGATQTISVPAGSLTLTAYAPTVAATQNNVISVPAGALSLVGYAPNVTGAARIVSVPSGALTLTGYAPTISNGAESFTSSAVFYIPLRMVTGLWSTSGVAASVPAGQEAWLPGVRQPIGYVYVGGQKLPVEVDAIFYRAWEFAFEKRLGGRGAPSVPDVVNTVAATQATAAAASATVAEVAQQTQANAEALFVVREVVQGGGLDGAEQIPGVDLR